MNSVPSEPQTCLADILSKLFADDAAWLLPRVTLHTAEDQRAACFARRDAVILQVGLLLV